MPWWASLAPRNLGFRFIFWDSFWFVFETGKFIFALGANAGKLTCVTCTSLSMGSICWPSLENEGREDRGMMKNISRENIDFGVEIILSYDS